MSFPLNFKDPDPQYDPEEFSISDNFNVLHISEIHSFQPDYRTDEYIEHIGKQMQKYVETYEIDRISILGDTGPIHHVESIMENLNDETEIWIIAGDEDKVSASNERKDWKGWFWQAQENDSVDPFDKENPYQIFDEGYETEINGYTVQAAHHPSNEQRPNEISFPDPRAVNEVTEPSTPEEMFNMRNPNTFLKELFSVRQDDNENTLRQEPPRMNDIDVALYDHKHMPYPRKIFDTAVLGLGGRSHNYEIISDCLPVRSLHLTSFGKDLVHGMHFDADNDEIFEHQIFDFEEELEVFEILTPEGKNHSTFYKPIQSRFRKTAYREKAKEAPEQYPTLWKNRNNN